MKYFFPDSHDLVDPSFDFSTERRSESRVRHRDDHYAHEVFGNAPYDGVLVSKAIVDGLGGAVGRYSVAQRQRLLRVGTREFFRLEETSIATMGDCGAFSYVKEQEPPFTVDDVIEFYSLCDFDFGLSLDHVILGYCEDEKEALPGIDVVPAEWRQRHELTLELAAEFLSRTAERAVRFTPVGVAQGWSPDSYADAVGALQKMGYEYIAVGGIVPLKTPQLRAVVEAIADVRHSRTRLHLLGVTRLEELATFARAGVASFDSTSPLRRAFKDDRDNYYADGRTFTAVRVPQVEANPKLMRRIRAGEIDQARARALESDCMESLAAYGEKRAALDQVLDNLEAYEELHDGRVNRRSTYRETLEARPWEKCPCEVCRSLGIHVVVFRGAERNRRRGFHNIYFTYNSLVQKLEQSGDGSGSIEIHEKVAS